MNRTIKNGSSFFGVKEPSHHKGHNVHEGENVPGAALNVRIGKHGQSDD
jgi:hypothetical protein